MAVGALIFLLGLAIVLRTLVGRNGGLAAKSGPLRAPIGRAKGAA